MKKIVTFSSIRQRILIICRNGEGYILVYLGNKLLPIIFA